MRASEVFVSQAARAYQGIRRMITTGELKAGEKVTLAGIAGKVNMSVIPVRDALKQLAFDRLVERSGRNSFRVLSLSRERVMELSILREALETQAARMCAEVIEPKQLEELRELASRLDRMVEAGLLGESVELEEELHLAIARIAGCEELTRELERLQLVYATFPVGRTQLASSHSALVDAIASNSPAKAERTMREHVRARREKILRSVGQVVMNEGAGSV
ncbi:MAG: GntR family transcriptional regulator [Planctomycetota bacterium]